MKLQLLSTLVVCALCSVQAVAQSYFDDRNAPPKTMQLYNKAMSYADQNEFDKAVKEFDKALRETPNFITAHIMRADCQAQLNKLADAETSFEKALAIDPAYKPKVLYSVALLEFKQKKYDEANTHLNKYMSFAKEPEGLKAKAQKLLLDIDFVRKAVLNPVPFNPQNMGMSINTFEAEYWPSITVDGNSLFFTVMTNGQEDFMVSRKVGGTWQKALPLGPPVNTSNNEGAQSISANGKFLVFTACNLPQGMGSCDLYFSELVAGKWSSPKNIGRPINSEHWESQPSISANGDALYFCRSKGGGRQENDIMVSYRKSNGTWETPIMLGASVNTPGNEESPFIHPDGQSLYFASNGHPGMGDMDLFLVRQQPDGSWGPAQNLGYPINSEGKEFGIIVGLDGKTAYFASDKTGGQGKLDLYTFELYEKVRPQPVTYVRANVTDEQSKSALTADFEVVNLDDQKTYAKAKTDGSGEFLVCLPKGHQYAMDVSKEKYFFHSENFDLRGTQNTADKPYELNIKLRAIPPAVATSSSSSTPPTSSGSNGSSPSSSNIGATAAYDKNKAIALRNVFFETASSALRDNSKVELLRLVKLLQENPSLRIQINGHTDNVGADAENMTLSEARARSVRDFLVTNGIATSRLLARGFGESQPIDTNDTPQGKANNRRTDFMIVQ
jgi:outer membrane protein OmpA-like peptidoglycan-associated protein/Tfp pilus assembly protein PilF